MPGAEAQKNNHGDHARQYATPVRVSEQRWPKDALPLVCISCVTYNHEKFIRDAIEGFLMQETTFPVEILIHDDASTDNTSEVIREYESRYPKLFRCFYQPENTYSRPDWRERRKPFINARRGAYIAMCDGDDFWTDPLKLQKQVMFLEQNPDYVLAYHDAQVVDPEGNILEASKIPDRFKRDSSSYDLMAGNTYILTLSLCYRKPPEHQAAVPERMNIISGDNLLTSLLGQYGKGKYLPDISPAVYRKHPGGVWSGLDESAMVFNKIRNNYWMYSYYRRTGKNRVARAYYARMMSWALLAGSKQRQHISAFGKAKNKIKNTVLLGVHRFLSFLGL